MATEVAAKLACGENHRSAPTQHSSVEVTQASVKGSKVGLTLAQTLHAGEKVVVTWNWNGGNKTLTAS